MKTLEKLVDKMGWTIKVNAVVYKDEITGSWPDTWGGKMVLESLEWENLYWCLNRLKGFWHEFSVLELVSARKDAFTIK